MPRGDDMTSHTVGHFGYSATPMDELGATEYTLVAIHVDESPSVAAWKDEMEKALGIVVESCQLSSRRDNLLLRLVAFNTDQREIHGFKLLSEIKPDDYLGSLYPKNLTALYRTAEEGAKTITDYGRNLTAADYDVNAILFIITDGMDNQGGSSPATVRAAIQEAQRSEAMESLRVVLVGVGDDDTKQYLDGFASEVGIDQFIHIRDATPRTLAKLAAFVSKSISAQSQALNSGGPSRALTF